MREGVAEQTVRRAIAVLCFVAILTMYGGCGGMVVNLRAPTARTFVAEVERRCKLAYTQPSPKGQALGFVCGSSADRAVHFAAMFTRRVGCPVFITLVASGAYRAQGCIGRAARIPEGRVTCKSNTVTIWARVLARAQYAGVQLGTRVTTTSKILSLNSASRARWGGAYFEVLKARKPVTPVLIERDRAGRVVGRSTLFRAGGCG